MKRFFVLLVIALAYSQQIAESKEYTDIMLNEEEKMKEHISASSMWTHWNTVQTYIFDWLQGKK